jgi:hypothetical protein
MEINKRENIGWIDLLRVTACFLVVFAHCCDPFVARFDTDRPTFLQGCALGSAVRCCVPLFVMMTGVLLFPVRNGMSEFYKKRIGRIVVPLIFWSVMLPVLYFIYLNYITTTDNPTIDMSAFTLEMTITKIWTFIFNFNYDTTPLWYLYMLVGLYFIIPIFHAWLERATRKDIKLFLSIWGISLFLPYIKMAAPALGYIGNWGNMDILGVCDWNAFGLLLTPWPLATILTAPLAGRLVEKVHPGLLGGIGMAIFATGLFTLYLLPPHPAEWNIIWRMALCGMGFGLFQTPNNVTIVSSAPTHRSGGASGMLGTARLLGQTLGTTLVALLFRMFAEGHRAQACLLLAIFFAIAAGVVSSIRMTQASPAGKK